MPAKAMGKDQAKVFIKVAEDIISCYDGVREACRAMKLDRDRMNRLRSDLILTTSTARALLLHHKKLKQQGKIK